MTKVKPRAIFIGPEDIGNVLSGLRKDWDFLPSVPNASVLWAGLGDKSIDNDIQAVFIIDVLFDPTGQDNSFETLVAGLSPYCFFNIVSYNPQYRKAIEERVEFAAYEKGMSDAVLYFFIDPTKPHQSLETALSEYIEKSQDSDTVTYFTGAESKFSKEDRKVGPEGSSLGEIEEGSKHLGQIIAVTSSKGGSGKSTVSITLATYLAHASEASAKKGIEDRPLKVIILDLDVRDGQLGFFTGVTKPSVLNLRINGISESSLKETIVHSKRLKVDLLLAPKKPRSSEDTPPEFFIELLTELRKRYDYIIVDTSVNYLDPLLEKVAYPTADQIVFVSDIVYPAIGSMTRWILEVLTPKAKGGMGINRNKVGIVVNKALVGIEMDSDTIERAALGVPLIAAIPSNPKLIAHSTNLRSMEQLLLHSQLRNAFKELAFAVVGEKYKLSNDF